MGLIRQLESSQVRLENQAAELETALKDLKRLQAQIVDSEKMSALGTLVAGIAHEINNPVTFIQGNIEPAVDYCNGLLELILLYEKNLSGAIAEIEEKKEDLDFEFLREDIFAVLSSIGVGSERIEKIVKSLRDFARLDESSIKTINLHEAIESTLVVLHSQLQTSARRNQPIQVEQRYASLPSIECFAREINQAIASILVNAIEAIDARFLCSQARGLDRKAGKITISMWILSTESIAFEIADNGTGMSERELQHVFEPFFTTKAVGQGTGLGMAIAHQIVTEKHGGTIAYTSQLDRGTTVRVVLPVALPKQTPRGFSQAESSRSGR